MSMHARPQLVFPAPGSGRARSTREALLLATEDLLRTTEVDDLGVRTVVRHARSSIGSFYDSLPTKRALLDQLLLRFFTTRDSFFAHGIDPDRWEGIDLGTRLTAMIDLAVDYNRAYPAFNRALLRHRFAVSEQVREPLGRVEASGHTRWVAFLAASPEHEAGGALHENLGLAVSTVGQQVDAATLVPGAERPGGDGSSDASFREGLKDHAMLLLTARS